ncbi:small nuclear ribonucleoprotein G-like isoform X2 [Lineus longissimus]|uniref:small nuclear ribonucleoprotein G-like isoform X2 n=1 Tax=Lineus longissimus TaxID=88925 RepID=UPI002B4D1A8E
MSKAHPPELKKYMDRKLTLKINGKRKVQGVLRGFDPFMNVVLDDAYEERKTEDNRTELASIGMVVIRGNSVILLESMERV